MIITKYLLFFILIILLFLAFFYRKPNNIIRFDNQDDVYAPAHGTIMDIIHNSDNTITIPIFLSILDIHRQNFPISGLITDVQHDNTGKFDLAYKINKSNTNEKVIHTVKNNNGIFKIIQISGLLARQIIYYNKPNTYIQNGSDLGIILFGSRVDLIIPNAHKFSLFVNKNDIMHGTDTLIGTYTEV